MKQTGTTAKEHTQGRVMTLAIVLGTALVLGAGLAVAPLAAQDATESDAQGEADARERIEITEDEAVALALDENLGIQSQRRDLATKERDRRFAWNQLLPSLQLSGSMARSNTEQEFSSLVPAGDAVAPPAQGPPGSFDYVRSVSEEAPRWSVSASFQATLDLSLRLYYAVEQTAIALREGRLSLADARDQVRRDVRKQFRQVGILEEAVALTERQLATAEQQVEQARTNVENGLADRSALLQAQIGAANLEVALQEQRNGLAAARRGLKNTLGVAPSASLELVSVDDGPDPAQTLEQVAAVDVGIVLEEFLGNRRELASLSVQIDRLRNLQELERAGLYPSMRLSFTADPAFQGDPFEDNWFEDADENWQQQRGSFSVTIAQPLDPLLPGSSTWTSIENYEDQIAQLRLQMEQARRGARLEVASIFERLAGIRTTIRARELNRELAQRNLDLARQGLESGNRGSLDVRQAEDALREAELNLARQYNNVYSALVDLAYALNIEVDRLLEFLRARG